MVFQTICEMWQCLISNKKQRILPLVTWVRWIPDASLSDFSFFLTMAHYYTGRVIWRHIVIALAFSVRCITCCGMLLLVLLYLIVAVVGGGKWDSVVGVQWLSWLFLFVVLSRRCCGEVGGENLNSFRLYQCCEQMVELHLMHTTHTCRLCFGNILHIAANTDRINYYVCKHIYI